MFWYCAQAGCCVLPLITGDWGSLLGMHLLAGKVQKVKVANLFVMHSNASRENLAANAEFDTQRPLRDWC